MTENTSFTAKAIDKVQRLPPTSPFAAAISEYLMQHNRIFYEPAHDAFWVDHPRHGFQVAVWMVLP
ncbi:hypothetical protein SAMN05518801_10783 [Novosphingobium sp. CF614]|uniref:hypothetical protein n=1 Tax=Novosphingobium sp. CF614 TaxID=1884364 RepID=UPI0008F1247C|nr:hypothetical protein [Novosphingobium sp. CF614]SFG09293.1 hypothetical protein SAMN05518801_10783 [Novosphingobium sp. CF614]